MSCVDMEPRNQGKDTGKPALSRRRGEVDQLRVQLASAHRLLHQKEVLLREMDHRIGNSLQLAAAMLSLQLKVTDNAGAREALAMAGRRLHTMGRVHATSSRHDGAIPLKEHLRDVCDSLLQEEGVKTGRVQLSLEAENWRWPTYLVATLGLFVNEAVTNALKYAYPDGVPGHIRVRIGCDDRGAFAEIADDGVGFSDELKSGLGMLVMRALTDRLNGELTIGGGVGRGACLRLHFESPVDEQG